MPKTRNRAVMIWLFIFAFSVAVLVIWGGYTRLTRSGLSIVEWHPISGVMPPVGEAAWQAEFAKYQETPEFQLINTSMTLEEYRFIFYIEWIHRMLARMIGLVYALPVFYFLWTKRIPWREAGVYVAMGLLFILQAFAGWFMVASGLQDRPSVSHYLLTFHLLMAMTLFGLSLWVAYGHRFGFPPDAKRPFSAASRLAAVALALLVLQIVYGGLTAGLKAGHVSDTWPLMSGRLIPADLLSQLQPWALNLVEAPETVAFIHRWLAFAVLGAATAVYLTASRPGRAVEPGTTSAVFRAEDSALVLLTIITIQIVFGICVVLFRVQMQLALVHQTLALGVLAANLLTLHRLRAEDPSA